MEKQVKVGSPGRCVVVERDRSYFLESMSPVPCPQTVKEGGDFPSPCVDCSGGSEGASVWIVDCRGWLGLPVECDLKRNFDFGEASWLADVYLDSLVEVVIHKPHPVFDRTHSFPRSQADTGKEPRGYGQG